MKLKISIDGKKVSLTEVLESLTDEKIIYGDYHPQTILDLIKILKTYHKRYPEMTEEQLEFVWDVKCPECGKPNPTGKKYYCTACEK